MRRAFFLLVPILVVVAAGILVMTAVVWSVAKAPAQAVAAADTAPRSTLLSGTVSYTNACLNDRVLALLDLGERDIEALTDYAVRRCGSSLMHFLTNELERPEHMAADYVRKAAKKEVTVLAGPAR